MMTIGIKLASQLLPIKADSENPLGRKFIVDRIIATRQSLLLQFALLSVIRW